VTKKRLNLQQKQNKKKERKKRVLEPSHDECFKALMSYRAT
jgi:hypothetical protein